MWKYPSWNLNTTQVSWLYLVASLLAESHELTEYQKKIIFLEVISSGEFGGQL